MQRMDINRYIIIQLKDCTYDGDLLLARGGPTSNGDHITATIADFLANQIGDLSYTSLHYFRVNQLKAKLT